MNSGFIRPIAICIIEHDGKLLVQEGHNPDTDQHFGRPLGGTIEFGELGDETIIREFKEELGIQITDIIYLATLENIFSVLGQQSHEIVRVYRGKLCDPELYKQPYLLGHEDNGLLLRAVWVSFSTFESGEMILVPLGIMELLK